MGCSKSVSGLALVLLLGTALQTARALPVVEPAQQPAGWVTTTYGCDGVSERIEVALHLDDGRVVPLRNAQVPEQATRVQLSPLAVTQIERTGSLDLVGTGCNGPFLSGSGTVQGGSGTLGAQRIVVILVNFRTDTEEHITANRAHDLLVEAGEWFGEVSFDQVCFSAIDVFGYYTVDIAPSASHTAIELADPDIDFTQYDRIVYGSRAPPTSSPARPPWPSNSPSATCNTNKRSKSPSTDRGPQRRSVELG